MKRKMLFALSLLAVVAASFTLLSCRTIPVGEYQAKGGYVLTVEPEIVHVSRGGVPFATLKNKVGKRVMDEADAKGFRYVFEMPAENEVTMVREALAPFPRLEFHFTRGN